MKLLAELNDANVLGMQGLSCAKPRITARAVVVDGSGRLAVVYAPEFGLYSLPGGGVERGESVPEALAREVAEETGCLCREAEELGLVRENRAHADYTQESWYYVVRTDGPTRPIRLTEAEESHGTQVCWMTPEEAWRWIAGAVHRTNQRRFLQARDVAALRAYARLRGEELA